MAIGLAIVEMSENITVRYIEANIFPTRLCAAEARGKPAIVSPPRKTYHRDACGSSPTRPTTACSGPTSGRKPARQPHSQDTALVRAVEDTAPELVTRIEEERVRAEIAHQKWLAEKEARDRAEDKKRIEQSKADSAAQLDKVIEHWTRAMSIRRFFDAVETQLADLPEKRCADCKTTPRKRPCPIGRAGSYRGAPYLANPWRNLHTAL